MDWLLTVSRDDTKCWTLLNILDENTCNLLKLFKPHRRRLYALLNDGRFIAVGDNSKGLLGLGHKRKVETFEEIIELKNLLIKDIVCGYEHVMVLTKDGQVWGWGWNTLEQSISSDNKEIMTPKRILDKDIVDVKCGWGHTLALKKDGKVMAWGLNGLGQLGTQQTKYQSLPVFIEAFENVFIEKIESGTNHSVAISKDGKAYGWGWNEFYQLGLADKSNQLRPVVIKVYQHSIESVVCSQVHTLFLTREGSMFVTNKDSATLQLVQTDANIIQIACVNYFYFNHNSSRKLYLACNNNKLYYWGDTQQDLFQSKPISTNLSLSQIISQHSQYQAFPKALYVQQKETRVKEIKPNFNFLDTLAQFFDSPIFSDVEFVFPDNCSIKAHRVVLFAASQHMSSQLCSAWQSLARIFITSYPYSVFYHYLSYLYNHTLSFDDLDQLVSLVRLAHEYQEYEFQQVCVFTLTSELNFETCSRVYELAIDLNLEQLEKQTSEMILQNIAQIKLTDGFKNMNAEKKIKLFDQM